MPKARRITVRAARRRLKWTLVDLSKKTGITWATIKAIESGVTRGNLIDRHRISDALGVPFAKMWPDSLGETRELMRLIKRERGEPRKTSTK